jgi:tryptophan synthase alpha chain
VSTPGSTPSAPAPAGAAASVAPHPSVAAGRARSVSEVFARCAAEGRGALVGYLPAGYPTVDGSVELFTAAIEGGCDLVEVGIPYSDPVMDGPTIQAAAHAALRAGFRLRDVFTVVERVAAAGGAAVVMTYFNPVLRYGVDAFARDLAAAGGLGVITPDLIPDEADEWLAASTAHGLDRIFLVAPSSTEERIAATAKASSGFLYATSTMGVTGARGTVDTAAATVVARCRPHTDLPVGVGLGVRSGDQAAEVAAFADAVIVGSALVSAAERAGAEGVRALSRELAAGVARGARAAVGAVIAL